MHGTIVSVSAGAAVRPASGVPGWPDPGEQRRAPGSPTRHDRPGQPANGDCRTSEGSNRHRPRSPACSRRETRNLSAQKQPLCARSAPPTSRHATTHTRRSGAVPPCGPVTVSDPASTFTARIAALCAASALDVDGGPSRPYLDGLARHTRDHVSLLACCSPAPGVLGVLVRHLRVPESVRVGAQLHS